MKTTISTFVTPEGKVRISNLVVDSYSKHFTASIGFKAKGKRTYKFKDISGTVTTELAEWLSKLTPEKVKIAADNEQGFQFVPTGRRLTFFQKYLIKRGIPEDTLLPSLVFESDNTSQSYAENPFRLVSYASGKFTLTLVNASSKKIVSHLDTSTGQITNKYYQRLFTDKEGNTRRSFITPDHYKRLIKQVQTEVETIPNHQTT